MGGGQERRKKEEQRVASQQRKALSISHQHHQSDNADLPSETQI